MSTFKDAYGNREFNLNSAAGNMNWMLEGFDGLEEYMTDGAIVATVDLHISNAKDEYFNEFEEDAPEDEVDAARAAAIEFITRERNEGSKMSTHNSLYWNIMALDAALHSAIQVDKLRQQNTVSTGYCDTTHIIAEAYASELLKSGLVPDDLRKKIEVAGKISPPAMRLLTAEVRATIKRKIEEEHAFEYPMSIYTSAY